MKKPTDDSTKMILKGLIDLFSQNRRWLLFFGTGTSCSLDLRLGMPALTEHLKAIMGNEPGWSEIQTSLEAGNSLEQALTGIGLEEGIKSLIQNATGDYIANIDQELRDDILLGKKKWAGERLIKALVHRLPPQNPRLPIVTANYDLLIEYSCARNGIRYTTGFSGEILRTWNWEQSQDSLNQCRLSQQNNKSMILIDPLPRVELLKVHGSINRFTDTSSKQQVECDLWYQAVPSGLQRIIAAPGGLKYEKFASILETAAKAREAENEAMAFAVIGYGFNDYHLHDPICSKVRLQDCPLLVLTRDLSEEKIKELHNLGKRVWILIAPRNSVAGTNDSQSFVYPPDGEAPVILNERLWSCDWFAERILGG